MDQIDLSGKQLQHQPLQGQLATDDHQAQAIFEAEDVWDDGMIKKILPDVGRLEDRLDVMLFKNLLGANTRKHEQFWGLKDTRGDYYFVVSIESQFLTV